jgi:hypothetical protein
MPAAQRAQLLDIAVEWDRLADAREQHANDLPPGFGEQP